MVVTDTDWEDFDDLDNFGISICTSGTRPTAHEGRHIYETDTNKTMVYTGAAWVELAGGGGTDHSLLSNLAWSVAGHTIDADISPTTNDNLKLGSSTKAFNSIHVSSLDGYGPYAQIDCLKNFDMNAHDIYDIDGAYFNVGATIYIRGDVSDNLDIVLPSGKNIELSNSNKITGLGTPTTDYDAATKKYVDDTSGGTSVHSALSNLAWSVAGHSIDADISPTTNQTLHLGSSTHAFSTIYVDSLSNYTTDAQIECLKNFDMNGHDIYNIDGAYFNVGATMYLIDDGASNLDVVLPAGKSLSMNSRKITEVTDPTANQDAATKYYVDTTGGITDHDNLNNLSWSVAGHSINADISPTANQTYHLGSASNAFNTIYVDSLSNYTTDAQIECLKNFDMNAHDIYDIDGAYFNVGATTRIDDDGTGNLRLVVATGKTVKIVVG